MCAPPPAAKAGMFSVVSSFTRGVLVQHNIFFITVSTTLKPLLALTYNFKYILIHIAWLQILILNQILKLYCSIIHLNYNVSDVKLKTSTINLSAIRK